MKTKLFIMALTVGLLGLSSCNNNDEPTVNGNVRMRQVTLTASIGGDDASTRTSYEYDAANKMLKGSWEAGDKLSVITIDDGGRATGVYNLTSNNTVPAATADFTGTMPAEGSYASLLCIYPAITENIDDAGAEWKTSDYFLSIGGGHTALDVNNEPIYQASNDNTDHIKNRDFMMGTPTITDSGLNVTLEKQMSVLRFELTFPASLTGQNLYFVQIRSESYAIGIEASQFWYPLKTPDIRYVNGARDYKVYFSPEFTIPSNGKVIAYSIGSFYNQAKDSKLTIKAYNNSNYTIASKEITLTKDFNMDVKGKVHHITATLEAEE